MTKRPSSYTDYRDLLHTGASPISAAGGIWAGGGGGGGGGGIVAPYIAWPLASLGNKVYICVVLDAKPFRDHCQVWKKER